MAKKYMFLFALFAVLFNPFSSNAQLSTTEKQEMLLKMADALGKIKTVVYKIDYKDKNFASRDTMRSIAVCSLRIAPRDKFNAYNSVDALREITDSYPGSYQHMKYDGKKVLFSSARFDTLDKVRLTIYDDKRTRHAVVHGYSSLLLTEYFSESKLFGKLSKVTEKFAVSDEILNDVPVYVMTFAPEDTEDYRDRVVKQYIRKSDYLPVAVSSFARWENMEGYSYTEVEYLAINPDIPAEVFKVGENETINARERYKAFKEKAKI